MWQQPEPWPGVQVTLSKRTPVASNRPRSKAPAMRQSVLFVADASLDPGILQRAALDPEGDAVIAAFDIGRIHQAAIRADRQEGLADRRRIIGAEAGEGGRRHFLAALLDGADHDRLGLVRTQLSGQFFEERAIEIGAIAEGGIEFTRQLFGSAFRVGHDASCVVLLSLGAAATNALPMADCGASMTARASPLSAIRPASRRMTR